MVFGERLAPIMLAFEAAVAVHFPAFFAAARHARVHRHAVLAAVALQERVTTPNKNGAGNEW